MYRLTFIITRVAIGVVVLLLVLSGDQTSFAQDRAGRIKAAALYYLAKFVRWPSSDEPLTLCTFGKDPLLDALESTLQGKSAAGRAIGLKQEPHLSTHEIPEQCAMVYFGDDANSQAMAVLSQKGNTALTVGSAESFLKSGGMIRIYEHDNRLKIRIHLAHVRQAGLELSSELLSIAETE